MGPEGTGRAALVSWGDLGTGGADVVRGNSEHLPPASDWAWSPGLTAARARGFLNGRERQPHDESKAKVTFLGRLPVTSRSGPV